MFAAGYPWLSGLRHVKHPPMSPFEAHYAPQVDGRAGSGETGMKRIHPGHPGLFAYAIQARCSFLKQRKKEPKNAFRRLKLTPPWSRTVSRHSSRENRQQPTSNSRRPTTASESSPQAILWTNPRQQKQSGTRHISPDNISKQCGTTGGIS